MLSTLIKKSTTFDVFLLNSVLKKLEFIAPEFLWIEVEKNGEELLKETELTEEEFKEVMEFLPTHSKDVPYLALAFNYKK